MEKINLLNLSLPALSDHVESLGEPRYRAVQLVKWLHQQGATDFETMTNLSKNFRTKLQDSAIIQVPEIIIAKKSADGTHKWLLRLGDGNAIETVFIPERDRGTLCVSSQVGCALNCSFCATGKEGFNRNLSLAEIIGQVWVASHALKGTPYDLTNVVMMGMGEPLLNYEPVLAAMNLMLDDNAYGLSKYRVTLSTSGVVPMMKKLREDSPVALAVSLHAPTNSLRDELVPLNKKYPLEELIPVCRDYFPATGKRRVTFEYVMLKGINDSLKEARELVRLLKDVPCKMNLIPFNPFEKTNYERSSEQAIAEFQQYLVDHNIQTWVRKTRGDDIDGACGQLAGDFKDRTGRNARWIRTGKLIPMVKEDKEI